ncbi:hypothetical protein GGI12_006245, partial [Dipsacomyces acuminosporus]
MSDNEIRRPTSGPPELSAFRQAMDHASQAQQAQREQATSSHEDRLSESRLRLELARARNEQNRTETRLTQIQQQVSRVSDLLERLTASQASGPAAAAATPTRTNQPASMDMNASTASFVTALPGTPLTPRRNNAVYQPLPQAPIPLDQGTSTAPGMAAKRNRLPDSLPTFDKGLTSDVKDPVDYILDVENQIVAARMDIDVWGPSAIVTGTNRALARMILESSSNKLPSSWTAACDMLLFLCPPAMTQDHARQKLQQLRLDVHQPFYRYTYEFDKLRRIAGIAETDDLALDFFLRGMPPILCDMAINYANARLGQDDPVSTLYAYVNQAEREFAIRTARNP